MTLEEAIKHPKVNVFDIWINKDGTLNRVHTYEKPGEDFNAYLEREERNIIKTYRRLKSKKP